MNMIPPEKKIRQIIKFVKTMYNPYKSKVVNIIIRDRKVYTIGFYFEEIPDDYLSGLSTVDPKRNKEYNLTDEIRTNVENYLGIKTTGLPSNKPFYPMREDHGITIVTQSDK